MNNLDVLDIEYQIILPEALRISLNGTIIYQIKKPAPEFCFLSTDLYSTNETFLILRWYYFKKKSYWDVKCN